MKSNPHSRPLAAAWMSGVVIKLPGGASLSWWGKRAATVAIAFHLLLTCASWRYRSPSWLGGLVDLSPSALVATLTLLLFPVEWAKGRNTQVEESSSLNGIVDDVSIVDARGSSCQELAGMEGVAARPPKAGPGAFLKRVARGVAGGLGKLTGSDSRKAGGSALHHELSFRRRSMGGRSRSSTEGGAPSSIASAPGARPMRRQTSGGRWQPSMARIASGAHLAGMPQDTDDAQSTRTASSSAGDAASRRQGAAASSASEARTGGAGRRRSEARGDSEGGAALTVPHSGALAVDCVACEASDPLMGEVAVVIRSEALLQFGALLGESSAELALSQAGAPGAVGGGARSLLGDSDDAARFAEGWEEVTVEHCARRGLHYWAWRRYLRRGLFMYKTRTVYEGVTPDVVTAFTFDSAYKCSWDDTLLQTKPLSPPCCYTTTPDCSAGGGTAPSGPVPINPNSPFVLADAELEDKSTASTAFMYARCRFPPPMASRDYVYARRVWAKPDDGGCYILSRSAPHPAPPVPSGRCVRVTDYVSGFVIRSCTLASGAPATEVVTVYFEDSHVSSGIMNLGVRKGLWPSAQKSEAALRVYMSTARASAQLSKCTAALARGRARGQGQAGKSVGGDHDDAAALQAGRALVQGAGAALVADVAGGKGKQGGKAARRPASKLAAAYHAYVVVCQELAAMGSAAGGVVLGIARTTFKVHLVVQSVLRRGLAVALSPARCVVAAAYNALLRAAAEAALAQQQQGRVGGGCSRPGCSSTSCCPSRNPSFCCNGSGPVSYPLDLQGPSSRTAGAGSKRQAARRLGRKLMTRMAAVAVRAVGLPLAHQLLSRASAASCAGAASECPTPAPQQQQAVQAQQQQAAQQQRRRGLPWGRWAVSPQPQYVAPTFGPAGYEDHTLYLHHDLHQHYLALQQLRQRRTQAAQQQQGQQQGAQKPPLPRQGNSFGRRVVVDGVIFG